MNNSIAFAVPFTAEVIESDNSSKVILSGTLMDMSANENNWKLHTVGDLGVVSSEVSGIAIKVQHHESDWEIIGTGDQGEHLENIVKYRSTITEPKAVAMFKSNTWNNKNMKVSPSVSYEKLICSVCGKDILPDLMAWKGHKHERGLIYAGKKCVYEAADVHLKEISLTSNPAYNCANIESVSFAAQVEKQIKEAESMSDNKNTDKLVAEKDKTITDLTAEIEKLKVEQEEYKKKVESEVAEKLKLKADTDINKKNDEATQVAEIEKAKEAAKIAEAEKDKKIEEIASRLKTVEDKNSQYIRNERAEILSKKIGDEKLIASILDSVKTDEQFTAEIEKIDMIVQATKGTAPIDNVLSAKQENDICLDLFGSTKEELISNLVGAKE